MQIKRFQNRVAESRMALPVTGVYALLVYVLFVLAQPELGSTGCIGDTNRFMQFLLLALSALLMMRLNNSNALIRIYSRMVSCSFIMLGMMSMFLFDSAQDDSVSLGIVQVCFVSFYLFMFSAYQDTSAVGRVFYAFLMLGIISIPFVQILYFVPFVWLLMHTNIMIGGFRVFVSSLFGLMAPYWLLLGLSFYLKWTGKGVLGDGIFSAFQIQCDKILQIGSLAHWADVPLPQILAVAFVVVLAILGMVHFRLNNYKDKIRTRMLFEFFSVMILLTLLLVVLQPEHLPYLLTLLIVSTSPVIGHYIALSKTFVTNITFCVMLAAVVALTLYNIWIFS